MLEALRHDPPGERFQRQHARLRHRSRAVRVMIAIGGGLIFAAGIVFLIIPGPGLPLVVVGLGFLAGLSGTLARLMDRAEPFIRRHLRRWRDRWHSLAGYGKALIVTLVALILGGLGVAAFQMIT